MKLILVSTVLLLVLNNSFTQEIQPYVELKSGDMMKYDYIKVRKKKLICWDSSYHKKKYKMEKVSSAIVGYKQHYYNKFHAKLLFLNLQDTIENDEKNVGFISKGNQPYQIMISIGTAMIISEGVKEKPPPKTYIGSDGRSKISHYYGPRYYLVQGNNYEMINGKEWFIKKNMDRLLHLFGNCGSVKIITKSYKMVKGRKNYTAHQMIYDIKDQYFNNCYNY